MFDDYQEAQDALFQMPIGHRIRVSKNVAKSLLVDETMIHKGKIRNISVESVGLGLYDITLKEQQQ